MLRSLSQQTLRLYAGAVFILPFLVVPFSGIAAELQKGLLAAFILGAALILSALAVATSGHLSLPAARILASAGLLPLVLVSVAAAFSVSPRMSLWGVASEWGTVVSLLCFAAAIFAGAVLSRRAIVYLFDGFLALCTLASVYFIERAFIAPQSLSDGTVAGSWTELPFLFALAAVLSLALFDRLEGARRWWYAACAICCVGALMCFYLAAAAYVGLGILFASCALSYLAHSYHLRDIAGCAAGVLVFVLILGSGIHAPHAALPAERRPSASISAYIIGASYADTIKDALFGTGPNTYVFAWERYRPASLNGIEASGETVNDAYSSALTLAVTWGPLALLAFLLSILAPLSAAGLRLYTGTRMRALVRNEALAGGFVLTFFTAAGAAIFSLGLPFYLLCGAGIGFSIRALSADEASGARLNVPMRTALAVLFALIGITLMAVASIQFKAAYEYAAGEALLLSGSAAGAAPLLQKAADTWNTPAYDHAASQAFFSEALIASNGANPDSATVKALIDKSTTYAEAAIQDYPHDYSSWLWNASLYTTLVASGLPGYLANAKLGVDQASQVAPTEPQPLYIGAQLALTQNDVGNAHVFLQRALALQPNYEDALALLQRLPQ